ncbi:unnamed protein product [Medioppia subpectinata]|uniref:Glutathione S-transferase n=1 Tax=Medioppia subpectinata TaxID=1979941 RepID=A0A7R9KS92_9ACAR|nr:unnamed protein product [Medioppia subpectinata]CAG2107676.1 unnamed protein product [Medioppia subpectinata]
MNKRDSYMAIKKTVDWSSASRVDDMPTLVDDGFALWESRAIMQYLCNRYAPDSTLYPKDPKQRALVDRSLNFDLTFLNQIIDVFTPIFSGNQPSADKVTAFNNSLKNLDQVLIKQDKYLVGDQLTLADLSLLACWVYLEKAHIDVSAYPNFQRWVAGLQAELPYYDEINPIHSVPTLVDNGVALWESRAIMQYLCNRYAPDSTLYPKDPKQRALVDRSLNFDLTFLNQISAVVLSTWSGGDQPADKLATFHGTLKLLDQVLIGQNKYLVGDNVTIADLSLLSMWVYLEKYGIDISPYANFQRWAAGLRAELPYYDECNSISQSEWDEFIARYLAYAAASKTK